MSESSMIEKDELPFFTKEEISQHNTPGDNWICINGLVYNFTGFENEHPGGKEWITMYAEHEDATQIFQGAHARSNPKNKFRNSRLIGRLGQNAWEGKSKIKEFLNTLFGWGRKAEGI